MKLILQKILALFAKLILWKYKPKIVGITGSIGKTSTKEACFAVLSSKFRVRKNIKNYNNELGVPLTIIGAETGGHSFFGWLKVLLKAKRLLYFRDKNYPEILVLEMGADKPGDISYLVDIAACHVGVLTKIGPTHLEFFGSVENVAKEKTKIIANLEKSDFAILNFDDQMVKKVATKTKAQIISYGYHDEASVRAVDLSEQGAGLDLAGIKFKINYGGSSVPVFLPGVVGAHQISSALAAAAVGVAFGLNLIEISDALKNYRTPRGRMSLIKGIKNSLIIDDTYNSSPEAAMAALTTMGKLNMSGIERKVAILGDMLELGEFTDEAHFELGRKAVESGIGLLICVGKYRNKIMAGARSLGFDKIIDFESSDLALDSIADLINENDLILVKGSQGSRMEKIVKALMREPEKASELLVRQTQEWAR